jgi:hypothetical protein
MKKELNDLIGLSAVSMGAADSCIEGGEYKALVSSARGVIRNSLRT